MERMIRITEDGSHTMLVNGLSYHSLHGAVQESRHVFIEAGLNYVCSNRQIGTNIPLDILEVGFGTGLNALLTMLEPVEASIRYMAVEAFPLIAAEIMELNYKPGEWLRQLHDAPWEIDFELNPRFSLHKKRAAFESIDIDRPFDLIYYDPFAPAAQPELWTASLFDKIYRWMRRGAVLTTYCCKVDVQRAMKQSGFTVEKLPGPPGKREILRATKQ
jgi:tRNA U34 5-methylaminomethyl-2-thiouridine-forming methyltransferase MnmC